MAGYGLTDAVTNFQQGKAWRDQQDQMDRAKKQQAVQDEATKAFSSTIDGSRAQFILDGGDEAAWKPDDTVHLRAAEARGATFAKAGDWEGFMRNEAALAPQRMRIRAQALQQYALDNDLAAFAKTVMNTSTDGRRLKAVEDLPGGPAANRGTAPSVMPAAAPKTMAAVQGDVDTEMLNPLGVRAAPQQQGLAGIVQPGTPGDGRVGAPTGKRMVRMVFDDGRVATADPTNLVQQVKRSLEDPVKAAELDAKARYEALMQQFKTEGAIKTERVKGEETRKTENVKGGFQKDSDERQAAARLTLADVDNEAAMARARVSASATTSAASIRAGGGGGGSGGKGDDGEIKTLAQANRAVETARNALNQATTAASKIRLEGRDGLRWTGEERAAEVDKDDEVKAARAEYQRALEVRNQLAKGDKPAAPAKPAGSRSNLFEVIR